MAMSRRTRGISSSLARRPRVSIGAAAYEDFRPVIEREQDQTSHFVLVYLPGFLKDQIRLVAENSSRIIRVHGERFAPAIGNKRVRFREEIIVPEDCQLTDSHANFEGGILRITLPKLIVPESEPASAADLDHSDQSSSPSSQPHTSPPKSPPRPASPIPPPTEKAAETPPQLQPLEESITPEKQSTSEPPTTLTTEQYPPPRLELQPPVMEGDRADDEGKDEDRSTDNYKTEETGQGKVSMMKNIGLKLNEERQQLLVNAGVAAMVIISLGAYISYYFGD